MSTTARWARRRRGHPEFSRHSRVPVRANHGRNGALRTWRLACAYALEIRVWPFGPSRNAVVLRAHCACRPGNDSPWLEGDGRKREDALGLSVMIAGLVVFLGAHTFTTQRELRARIIDSAGEGTYKIVYSL